MATANDIAPPGASQDAQTTLATAGFTPGPWSVIRDAHHPSNRGITASGRRHIARVYAASMEADPVCESNATLIAAAPDLYEALKALRSAVAANPEMQGRQYVSLGIQVTAALAKAEA